MIASLLKQSLKDHLDNNFDRNSKYFEYEYKVFYELESVVHEIAKCQTLFLNFATITATNHFLERFLKLALIHKAAGVGLKHLHQLNELFLAPAKKYGSLTLANFIKECEQENLIDSEEKDFLFNYVRITIRNGFSHSDAEKILSQLPDEKTYYRPTSDKTAWDETTFNPKIIPQIQAAHMESFANEIASSYFDYVFQLMTKIENRLFNLQNK